MSYSTIINHLNIFALTNVDQINLIYVMSARVLFPFCPMYFDIRNHCQRHSLAHIEFLTTKPRRNEGKNCLKDEDSHYEDKIKNVCCYDNEFRFGWRFQDVSFEIEWHVKSETSKPIFGWSTRTPCQGGPILFRYWCLDSGLQSANSICILAINIISLA